MAKHLLEIIYVEPLDGVSKKSGNEYHMRLAQCVVHMGVEVEGKLVQKKLVGELVLPDRLKDTVPGRYIGEFELSISRDKRIGSQLVSLVPHMQNPIGKAVT